MLSRFISSEGLSEFVLDGLEDDVVVDLGAMRLILAALSELRKLSIRNTNQIDAKPLGELVTLISDLIKSEPPKLEELDFSGLGGSAEQGNQIMA